MCWKPAPELPDVTVAEFTNNFVEGTGPPSEVKRLDLISPRCQYNVLGSEDQIAPAIGNQIPIDGSNAFYLPRLLRLDLALKVQVDA